MLDSNEDSWNERLLFGAERDLRDPWVQSFHLTGSRGLKRLNYSQQTAVFGAVLRPNCEVGKACISPASFSQTALSLFIIYSNLQSSGHCYALSQDPGRVVGTLEPGFLHSKHGSSA